jgi:hypothetical protein
MPERYPLLRHAAHALASPDSTEQCRRNSRPAMAYGPVRLRSSGRKISWTICRIPVRPFVVHMVKLGQPGRPKSDTGEVMTQYLVAIYRPENYDPAVSEDEAMGREIDALNDQMNAAGVRW